MLLCPHPTDRPTPLPLLAAKARVPALPRPHIPRPHLVAALLDALSCHRLVMLTAGGLSGKTCLLTELAGCAPTWRVFWYSVDDLDAGARALLEGLALAVAGHVPSGDDTQVLARIIGELDADPAPCVLIIDDCHRAADLPAIADRLLRYLPLQARLLLSARPSPSALPALCRWLEDRGQVAHFETPDLCLTPDEQQRFREITGHDGGTWAVGYRAGGQPALVDGLHLGVLPELAPELVMLVDLLAVLPTATARLVASALGLPEAEADRRLRLLAEQTILLEWLGVGHYRLGEAAQAAALARLDGAARTALRLRAAAALEPIDPCLAAYLFALSGCAERAMLAARGASLWEWQRLQSTALAIEGLLPARLLRTGGSLALTVALWRFVQRGAAAAHALVWIVQPATTLEQIERLRLLGRCAAARGRPWGLRCAVERLEALTRSCDPQLTATVRAYGIVSVGVLRCLGGEYQAAAVASRNGLELAQLGGHDEREAASVRLLALHTLALAHRRLGSLDEAEALYAQAQAQADAEGKPYAQLELANNRAVLLQQRGRHEESTMLVRAALASPWVAECGLRPVLLATLADALAALNDPAGAAQALRAAAAEVPVDDLYGIRGHAHAMLALLLAEDGHGPAAEVEIAAGAPAQHPATCLARALLHDPCGASARPSLERALHAAGSDVAARAHVQAHLARVCAIQGDRHRALAMADALAQDGHYPLTPREATILGPYVGRVRRARSPAALALLPAARIALRFFGRPMAFVDGRPLGSAWWWQSKTRELFWYALAHGAQGFTREEACADLYPELDTAVAGRALRNALYELRKLIAAQCGVAGGVSNRQGRLQLLPGDLGPTWESDLQALEESLRGLREGRQESTDLPLLLAGPFLADLQADWTHPYRRYWEQEAVRALELAADLYETAGRAQEALACLRRELEFCQDDTALVRRMMALCHTVGDMGGVRAAYQLHCRSAREDLDAPPDPEITALYRTLIGV